MSIYDKLSDIQMELLNTSLETKHGFHGQFIGLEELTCKILPLCYKQGLFYYFTANETHLILKILDKETKEFLSPAPHVRLPELTKDNKIEGGNLTYMKRYLLMNTFLIIAESFDPDDTQNGLPPEKNNASSAKKDTMDSKEETVNVDVPSLFTDAVDLLHKKGLEDKNINFAAIRKQIFKNGDFTQTERDEIAKYCKANWRPSK